MSDPLWQFSLEHFELAIWATVLIVILVGLVLKTSMKFLVIFTMLVTLILISLGAYVRLADAGLGCPDWPGCYGKLIPSQAAEEIGKAQAGNPNGPVTFYKAWTEMIHRYLASIVGVMIFAIFLKHLPLSIYKRKELGNKNSITLPLALFVAVIFQGMLGKWTVTMLLKPGIVTLHLAGGMFILGCLAYMSGKFVTTPPVVIRNHQKKLNLFTVITIVVVFMQILLGGWVSTNYAALVCADFPLCQGMVFPPMDFLEGFNISRELGKDSVGQPLSAMALTSIHWVHRMGAAIASGFIIYLVFSLLKQTNLKVHGIIILGVLTIQIFIGVVNILFLLPFWAAVAHNAVAGVLLSVLVMLKSRLNT